jgi:hypothetical protein
LVAARDSIELAPGDPWPAIELASVTGGTIETEGAGPRLVYFSASWCRGCIRSLPKVRRLAAAHPELRIVYVLWDGLTDAQEFVTSRGPIPAEVAWTDQRARELLGSQVMTYVTLPSFVLVDARGTVVATSDDTELEEIEARLQTLAQDGAP